MLPEMCLVQCRLDLFNVTCEDVCYESLSVHDFARCRYCVLDTCEVHGLVQGNDGLCHANAGLRCIARHKESAWIRAFPGPAGASHGYLRIRGRTTGPIRRARERSRSLRVRESKIPLPGRQTYSRLHKSALLQHRKGSGCTSV